MDHTENSALSSLIPNLQIAWDSTSLGLLKECPYKYRLAILEGWQPRRISVHLTFGLHYHAALERYDHARFAGEGHEAATILAVRYALEATWDKELGRGWISDDKYKNRLTLVRTVVWYLEQFRDDPIETVRLANGKPAVELSFRYEIGYESPSGEPYLSCGHLDRMGTFQDQTYIIDRKTSKSIIDQSFFEKFSPDNQFSTYALAGSMVYSLPIQGIIVDGAQIAIGFSRFARGIVQRTPEQLAEWHRDLGMWLRTAEGYAKAGHWPQNEKSCGSYGGCQFRGVCAKSPSVRERWLKADFTKRIWDPLQVRGDI
jgi:hypothetical protein